jgi:hypothetical protein
MSNPSVETPAESEIRFLEYRLETVSRWPPSARKHATVEAISRRLTTFARSALIRPEIQNLVALSCHLLDDIFEAERGA